MFKIVDGEEIELSPAEEAEVIEQRRLDAAQLTAEPVEPPAPLTPAEKLAAAGLTVPELKSQLGLK